jgi:hypothetical protein
MPPTGTRYWQVWSSSVCKVNIYTVYLTITCLSTIVDFLFCLQLIHTCGNNKCFAWVAFKNLPRVGNIRWCMNHLSYNTMCIASNQCKVLHIIDKYNLYMCYKLYVSKLQHVILMLLSVPINSENVAMHVTLHIKDVRFFAIATTIDIHCIDYWFESLKVIFYF